MLAPAGTAAETVARYDKAVNEILRSPRVEESVAKQGLTTVGGAPERLGDFIAKEVVRWQEVVREAGIVAE